MKKVIRTIATVALLLATTVTMAKEPKLKAETATKSVVFEWEDQLANTSLSFVDTDGAVIYTDKVVEVEDYIKKFNLATLSNGSYFLIVENEVREIIYTIDITENDILITNKDENLKPVFKKKDGHILMNYLNVGSAKVKVAVYDSLGRSLFAETFEDQKLVTKIFNFKNAFEGEYTIVVNSDADTFYEYVSVK